MIKVGDRVSFVSYAVPPGCPPRKETGIVEYQDGPNNWVVLTDSGVRHSVPKSWLEVVSNDQG